uniref:Nuclear receptor domain-containing protein n=1 Tax=Parastrongyloides trichosuri TaxID=131310 RepID=A0A0N4Z4T3_PARTI
METNSEENNVCLICGIESNSIHNGVNSCRRGVKTYETFRCRRGNKKCELKPGDKSFCKYCRFQRCLKVGMVIKSLQISSTQSETSDSPRVIQMSISPTPVESFNGNHELSKISSNKEISFFSNKKEVSNEETIKEKKLCPCFNGDEIKAKIYNIFNSKIFFYNSNKYETCLQKLIRGIDKLVNDLGYNNQDNVVLMKRVEIRKYIEHCQSFLLSSPNLLMNLEEFSLLSNNDKGIIFGFFWGNAFSLLNGEYVAKLYDPTSRSEPLLLIDSSILFNINDVEFVEPDVSQQASNEAYDLYKPTLLYCYEYILKPIKIFNFEKIEIAYMILQMIFSNTALESTSSECKRIAECILQVANNELHNYYIYNKKITNYAYRLSEMTKLLYTIKEYCDRWKEVAFLAKWLDIVDLSIVPGL